MPCFMALDFSNIKCDWPPWAGAIEPRLDDGLQGIIGMIYWRPRPYHPVYFISGANRGYSIQMYHVEYCTANWVGENEVVEISGLFMIEATSPWYPS